MSKVCSVCGKRALYQCSRCKQRNYCGLDCRDIDWKDKNHQSQCVDTSSTTTTQRIGAEASATKVQNLPPPFVPAFQEAQSQQQQTGSRDALDVEISRVLSSIQEYDQEIRASKLFQKTDSFPTELLNAVSDGLTQIGVGMTRGIQENSKLLVKLDTRQRQQVEQLLASTQDAFVHASSRLDGDSGYSSFLLERPLDSAGGYYHADVWQDFAMDSQVDLLLQEFATRDRSGVEFNRVLDVLLDRHFQRKAAGLAGSLVDPQLQWLFRLLYDNRLFTTTTTGSSKTIASELGFSFVFDDNSTQPIGSAMSSEEREDAILECVRSQSRERIYWLLESMEDGFAGLGYSLVSQMMGSIKERANVAMDPEKTEMARFEVEKAANSWREGARRRRAARPVPLSEDPVLSDVVAAMVTIGMTIAGVFLYRGVKGEYERLFEVDKQVEEIARLAEESEKSLAQIAAEQARLENLENEVVVEGVLLGNLDALESELKRLDSLTSQDKRDISESIQELTRELRVSREDIETRLERYNVGVEEIITRVEQRGEELASRLQESRGSELNQLRLRTQDLKRATSSLETALYTVDEVGELVALFQARAESMDRPLGYAVREKFRAYSEDVQQWVRDTSIETGSGQDKYNEVTSRVAAMQRGVLSGYQRVIDRQKDPDKRRELQRELLVIQEQMQESCAALTETTFQEWASGERDRTSELSQAVRGCGDQISASVASINLAASLAETTLEDLRQGFADQYRTELLQNQERLVEINERQQQVVAESERDQEVYHQFQRDVGTLAQETTKISEELTEALERQEARAQELADKAQKQLEVMYERRKLSNELVFPALLKYTRALKQLNTLTRDNLTTQLIPTLKWLTSTSTSLASRISRIAGELLTSEKIRVAVSSYFTPVLGANTGTALFFDALFDVFGLNTVFRLVDMGTTLRRLVGGTNPVSLFSPGTWFTSHAMMGMFSLGFNATALTMNLASIRRRANFVLPVLDLLFVKGTQAIHRLFLWALDWMAAYLEEAGERVLSVSTESFVSRTLGKAIYGAGTALFHVADFTKMLGNWAGWGYDHLFRFVTGATDSTAYIRSGYTSLKQQFVDYSQQLTTQATQRTGVDIVSLFSNSIAYFGQALMFSYNVYALATGQIAFRHMAVLVIDLIASNVSTSMLARFGGYALSIFMCSGCSAVPNRSQEDVRQCRLAVSARRSVLTAMSGFAAILVSGVYFTGYFPTQIYFQESFADMEKSKRLYQEKQQQQKKQSTSSISSRISADITEQESCPITRRTSQDSDAIAQVYRVVAKSLQSKSVALPRKQLLRGSMALQGYGLELYANLFLSTS